MSEDLDEAALARLADTPPGDEENELYSATGIRLGGAPFLWFVTKDKEEDRILPMADIRKMEPPGPRGSEAFIHFSGFCVKLTGTGLRLVMHKIFMRHCSSLHERAPGKRVTPGEPVIERMEFFDTGQPRADKPDDAPRPRGPSASH